MIIAAALLAKTTLLLVLALIVAAGLRSSSAASRHFVWCSAFVGILLVVLLTPIAPAIPVVVPSGEGILAATVVGIPGQLPSTPSPRFIPLIAVWAAGALAIFLIYLFGHVGLARLAAGSRSVTSVDSIRLLDEVTRRHGIIRPVRLLSSPLVAAPVTWGVVRPIIVVPDDIASWNDAKRRAVLTHEAAHIGRHDVATQAVARFVCACLWFHPLVWIAARRLRVEAERACDDSVLVADMAADEYAAILIDVARGANRVRFAGLAAIGMAKPSQLEGRVLSILADGRIRRGLSRRDRWLASAAALGMVLPLAALQPVRSARQAQAQASPPIVHYRSDSTPPKQTKQPDRRKSVAAVQLPTSRQKRPDPTTSNAILAAAAAPTTQIISANGVTTTVISHPADEATRLQSTTLIARPPL